MRNILNQTIQLLFASSRPFSKLSAISAFVFIEGLFSHFSALMSHYQKKHDCVYNSPCRGIVKQQNCAYIFYYAVHFFLHKYFFT